MSFVILNDIYYCYTNDLPLTIDTKITNDSGSNIVGCPEVIDIIGIIWNTVITYYLDFQISTRKYTFAIFMNWSKRFFGRKFRTEYFDVWILLLLFYSMLSKKLTANGWGCTSFSFPNFIVLHGVWLNWLFWTFLRHFWKLRFSC